MFVYGKLDGVERDSDSEGGRIGDVEGFDAFGAIDVTSASDDVRECRVVNLHALFYYFHHENEHERHVQKMKRNTPSKGFMNASLVMEAQAPANAAQKR